ncbi:hypothetical protein G6011_06364 [Alternaria panax]|uniref:F-box domain-containing protein n=1 Tax=Alternaria panax TaxID=48097 RepID=A0AAD4FIX8_9PLEO|nr:hypothetical protein G6011_06364 [Alternaria panax]
MDDLLPSYESVVRRDPWVLVAPYLPSQDLCSAALVCRQWHQTFTPNLWGSPASHFGVENDTVYVALTRFKRTLPYARASVRELTHTLRFPPAHAELYDGPHAEWLRDCLEHLPRLQCLIVDGLPFFDHASLLSLRHSSLRWRSTHPTAYPVFGLRLLDASSCMNATSMGLAETLPHFPDLVSLDLTKTAAARDKSVLSTLKYLRNLRVLNLRGTGIKDEEFSIVAHAIGSRVRSLDISNNFLTDTSVRLLLELCLKETTIAEHTSRGPLPPVQHNVPSDEPEAFESENLVGHLRKKLTEGFIGSLAIEKTSDVGVSHLYLSSNAVTVEGTSALLRSGRLQVLDVGILPAVVKNPSAVSPGSPDNDVDLPSVSKLTPVLTEYASRKLRYLRINYELVTEDAPVEAPKSPRAELSGDLGIYKPLDAHELEAVEPSTPELDSECVTIHELSGNSVYPAELPGSLVVAPSSAPIKSDPGSVDNDKQINTNVPAISITPQTLQAKQGPAPLPEHTIVDSPLTPPSPLRKDENYRPGLADGIHDARESLSSYTPPRSSNMSCQPTKNTWARSRASSFYYIEDRKAWLNFRHASEHRLHPGMLPKLHTLVLTDVPTMTTNKKIVHRIIQYIKDAAEEASIARKRAEHTYVLPPGRRRVIAEEEYARNQFALRRVVLEMVPPQSAPKKITSSWRAYPTKSSTEDADSDAFWDAAAHDFSFFDDEECGQPGREPNCTLPLVAMSGLELAPSRSTAPAEPSKIIPEKGLLFDVVGEISKFRRERKAAYINSVAMGEADPDVEGYWPGNITILRKPVNPEAGKLDWYGNRYEYGWYYR